MAGAAGNTAVAWVGSHALRRFWYLLKQTLIAGYKDNAYGIAKGAAYSGVLSFFPLLTTVTAVLVQANAESVSRILTSLVFEAVPPGTHETIRVNVLERGSRPILVIIGGAFVSLWAASGVILTLTEGFRAAYGIKEGRPFWRARGMAFLLILTSALPVVLASTLMVVGERSETWLMMTIGLLPRGEKLRGWILFFGLALRYLILLGAIALSLASLYYFGPNHPDGRRRARALWPGAFLATIAWFLATGVFAWWVRNIANYNVLYGSIAAVVALAVWMYVLSIVAIMGCEFNAQTDRMRESGLNY